MEHYRQRMQQLIENKLLKTDRNTKRKSGVPAYDKRKITTRKN